MFPLARFLALYLKFFFLLTPFFVLGVFLSLTEEAEDALRNKLAVNISLGAAVTTLLIFLLGAQLMLLFDITVDAFRAGSGVLLLLTAVSLVLEKKKPARHHPDPARLMDLAVVPMATPITAGPATLGALMVMGTSTPSLAEKAFTSLAILLACLSIGAMLMASRKIQRLLGGDNIAILSKVTGLVLSAMAAQMIVTGVKNLWFAP